MRHWATINTEDVDEFVAAVEADGGRVTRVLEGGGAARAEVEDLRHHEVVAAGAIEAHPLEDNDAEYRGRRVRHLGPARKALARRQEQMRELRAQARIVAAHLRELELYHRHLEAGGDVRWRDLPPQAGWWLEGYEVQRGPWDPHSRPRPWIEGVHDVLDEERRAVDYGELSGGGDEDGGLPLG